MEAAERVAAGLALLCCAPVLIGSAIAVRTLSGRCPLVAHKRVGVGGDEFWMLKLRTMWGGDDGPRAGRLVEYLDTPVVPDRKGDRDPRVTSRFAALLRRYSIDEMPQLVHVLSGRMSLVGPRPLTRCELDAHYGPEAREVLRRRPGMTGLWQVLGRSRLSYAQRKRLDLMLVRNWSVGLWSAILLRTPVRVLSGRDAY